MQELAVNREENGIGADEWGHVGIDRRQIKLHFAVQMEEMCIGSLLFIVYCFACLFTICFIGFSHGLMRDVDTGRGHVTIFC